MSMNRRELISNGAKLALVVAVGNTFLGSVPKAFFQTSDQAKNTKAFPATFLWGAATAAHQVEAAM